MSRRRRWGSDVYSGHTKTRQSERCAAFQETVSDVTGFDFFQDWHAMYGASVVSTSFLQAVDRLGSTA